MRDSSDRDKIIEYLKNEYDLAKHEWKYYTDLSHKQDHLYSIYFAVFAVMIGAIYYIIQINNKDSIFDDLILMHYQRMIICGLIIFLAVTYMYLFIMKMGSSYDFILYREKVIIFEKSLNYFMTKNIFIWETEFMSKIQSKDHVFTKGYFNVNMIKMIFAVVLYGVIEIPLCILWHVVVGNVPAFYVYIIILIIISLFLLYDWFVMCWRLPAYYRKELKKIYKKKLKMRI